MTKTSAESIADALEHGLSCGEIGLQVAAYKGNELVVDDWAGRVADGGAAVEGDTLFPVFSVSKAITSTAVHVAASHGHIDISAPVVEYWPEYGDKGKEKTTVQDVLAHRSGVPLMPEGVAVEHLGDWDWVTARIAELEPISEPGTISTYMAMTYGWVLGEIIRRADPAHRYFDAFVRAEIFAPLAIEDIYFGRPDSVADRVATLSGTEEITAPPRNDPPTLREQSMPWAVSLRPAIFNEPDVQRAVIPAVGGIMSARAGARFWAMLANGGELDGVRILPEAAVHAFLSTRSNGDVPDPVMGGVLHLGEYGYWLGTGPTVADSLGPGRKTICHPGAGGMLGWANLETGFSGMICKNFMRPANPDPAQDVVVRLARAMREAE